MADGVSPYATKREVATTLNMSRRHIDRLIAAGQLTKIKTGANRSGIPRESLEAYLANLNGPADEVSTKVSGLDAVSSGGTRLRMLLIDPSTPHPGLAALIDDRLAERYPAATVGGRDGRLMIYWPARMGYAVADVLAVVKGLEAQAALMT